MGVARIGPRATPVPPVFFRCTAALAAPPGTNAQVRWQTRWQMSWLTTRRLVLAALAVWLAIAASGLVLEAPLGHDEAAFALVARGDQPPGAWLYRSDGTVALARVGLALGGAVWQLRLLSAALGTSVVIAAFAVGRAAFTARTGAWAAAIVAGAHPMVLRSAQLLGDLPSAAAVLGAVAVIAAELDRDSGPRWRITGAAPLFAAAFYFRYGSALAIALALAAAGALWWRTIAARPQPVLALVALLAALAIPHIASSLAATGTPLGILSLSAAMPRRAYPGDGLVTYVASNPLRFYGAVAAPVMVAGLASLVGALGLARPQRRAAWYLAIIAVGQLAALGLESHGQPRYVYVATVMLIVLGTGALCGVASRPRLTALALAAIAAAWLGALAAAVYAGRQVGHRREPLVTAARAVRADAADRPCRAIAAIAPQLIWYSGCIVDVDRLLRAPPPVDRRCYAVSVPGWRLDGAALAARWQLRAVPLTTDDPEVQIWRLE